MMMTLVLNWSQAVLAKVSRGRLGMQDRARESI